jgi:hypothetical protein
VFRDDPENITTRFHNCRLTNCRVIITVRNNLISTLLLIHRKLYHYQTGIVSKKASLHRCTPNLNYFTKSVITPKFKCVGFQYIDAVGYDADCFNKSIHNKNALRIYDNNMIFGKDLNTEKIKEMVDTFERMYLLETLNADSKLVKKNK